MVVLFSAIILLTKQVWSVHMQKAQNRNLGIQHLCYQNNVSMQIHCGEANAAS